MSGNFGAKLNGYLWSNGPRYIICGNQLKSYSPLGSIASRCSGNEPALLSTHPAPLRTDGRLLSGRTQRAAEMDPNPLFSRWYLWNKHCIHYLTQSHLFLLPQLDLGKNMRITALSTAGVLIKSHSTGNYSFMYASQYFLSYKREDDKAWRRYHKNDVSVTVRYQPLFHVFMLHFHLLCYFSK